jgi:tRNA(Ile)-lysidine synthase TilS/MesJ
MDVRLEPGRYIVAVSGGVDSVVLLNVLSMLNNIQLIVAHFDHGMRVDSADDAEFVRSLAAYYSLPFEFGIGKLGENASEAIAKQLLVKAAINFWNKCAVNAVQKQLLPHITKMI